jgi:hypothetical protein
VPVCWHVIVEVPVSQIVDFAVLNGSEFYPFKSPLSLKPFTLAYPIVIWSHQMVVEEQLAGVLENPPTVTLRLVSASSAS